MKFTTGGPASLPKLDAAKREDVNVTLAHDKSQLVALTSPSITPVAARLRKPIPEDAARVMFDDNFWAPPT